MSFPDLTLRTGGALWSVATGTPVNGNNTIDMGLPDYITQTTEFDPNWVFITVESLGPSIGGVTFVGYSLDHRKVILNFNQTGTDQATVELRLVHSLVR